MEKMKKLISVVFLATTITVLFFNNDIFAESADETVYEIESISITEAKDIMSGWFLQTGYFPAQWSERPYFGGKLIQLDSVETMSVDPIPVPAQWTTTCKKVWMTVSNIKGIYHNNGSDVPKNQNSDFDRTGTFSMCLDFQNQWVIEFSH